MLVRNRKWYCCPLFSNAGTSTQLYSYQLSPIRICSDICCFSYTVFSGNRPKYIAFERKMNPSADVCISRAESHTDFARILHLWIQQYLPHYSKLRNSYQQSDIFWIKAVYLTSCKHYTNPSRKYLSGIGMFFFASRETWPLKNMVECVLKKDSAYIITKFYYFLEENRKMVLSLHRHEKVMAFLHSTFEWCFYLILLLPS